MAEAPTRRISIDAIQAALPGAWPRLVAALLLIAFIGWPLGRLAVVALGSGIGTVVATLLEPSIRDAIFHTAWTALVAAVLAVGMGTAAALATERGGLPARNWLRAGILLPLLCPPFITAFGWARAFGPRGLTDQLVGVQLPGLYGPLGIVLVLVVSATPLAWLIMSGALASRVEPDAHRAARASGAGSWMTLRTVTLPLIRPAIVSALVVTFVFSANAFGVPAVLGTPAGFSTITTRLYQDLARSSDPAAFIEAAILAATLVVVALAVVGPTDAWLTGRPAARTGGSAGGEGATGPLTKGRVAVLAVFALAVGALFVVPLFAVGLTAVTRAVGLAPVPANWTLANFAEVLDRRFFGGLIVSLSLAVAAATIVLPLGGLLAALGRRRGFLRVAATLGFALPGSALAIAILLAYGGWLRNSLVIILIAYVAKFWALGHRQLAGSLDTLPTDATRAARASGAGPLITLRSVVVPYLWPSLLAAWLMVFLFAFHELTMSSLLYGPTTATLSVVVLNAQQLGDPTVSAALAMLIVGIVALVAVPLVLIAKRRR